LPTLTPGNADTLARMSDEEPAAHQPDPQTEPDQEPAVDEIVPSPVEEDPESPTDNDNDNEPLLSRGVVEGDPKDWTYWEVARNPELLAGSLPLFFGFIFVTATTPIMPFFMDTIGADDEWIGVILSANFLAQMLGSTLVAPLAKLVRHRRVLLLVGTVVHVITVSMVAFHPAVWTLCVERGSGGFVLGMAKILARSLIRAKMQEEAKGKAFGIMNAVSNFGLLLGPAFSAVAYAAGGMRLTFMCLSFLVGIEILFLVWMPANAYDTESEGGEKQAVSTWSEWLASVSVAIQQPITLGLTLQAVWEGIWFGFLFLLLPLQLVNYFDLDSTQVAMIWICFDLGAIPCSILGGWLADSYDPYFVSATTLALKCLAQAMSGYGRLLPADGSICAGVLIMSIGAGLCMDLWDVNASSVDKLTSRAADRQKKLHVGGNFDDIVFGIVQSSQQLAITITFWSGVPLDRALGWAVLMFTHAILGACVMYPIAFWLIWPLRTSAHSLLVNDDTEADPDLHAKN